MEIRVRNLSRSFGQETVLKSLSLEIPGGESVLLYGKNGVGKTTLMRILNLLESPDEGEVEYRTGETRFVFRKGRVRSLEIQRRMVLVLQQPVVFRGSLLQNVNLGLELRREPVAEGETERGLKKFGLWELRERSAAGFSLGQKQKISLLRSFLPDCECIFLDEPMNHLDEKGKGALTDYLLEKRMKGTTLVVATPNLKDWDSSLFDRIYHLREDGLYDASSGSKRHCLEEDSGLIPGED